MKPTILSVLICIYITNYSATAQSSKINWLSFQELTDRFEKEQKPIFISLYTDWCKYCKIQDEITFKDSTLIESLNENYYCLRFNAETKKAIFFFGREYEYNSEKGFHDLAIYLGSENGKLSFPTTTILNNKLQIVFRRTELVSKDELLNVMSLYNSY